MSVLGGMEGCCWKRTLASGSVSQKSNCWALATAIRINTSGKSIFLKMMIKVPPIRLWAFIAYCQSPYLLNLKQSAQVPNWFEMRMRTGVILLFHKMRDDLPHGRIKLPCIYSAVIFGCLKFDGCVRSLHTSIQIILALFTAVWGDMEWKQKTRKLMIFFIVLLVYIGLVFLFLLWSYSEHWIT